MIRMPALRHGLVVGSACAVLLFGAPGASSQEGASTAPRITVGEGGRRVDVDFVARATGNRAGGFAEIVGAGGAAGIVFVSEVGNSRMVARSLAERMASDGVDCAVPQLESLSKVAKRDDGTRRSLDTEAGKVLETVKWLRSRAARPRRLVVIVGTLEGAGVALRAFQDSDAATSLAILGPNDPELLSLLGSKAVTTRGRAVLLTGGSPPARAAALAAIDRPDDVDRDGDAGAVRSPAVSAVPGWLVDHLAAWEADGEPDGADPKGKDPNGGVSSSTHTNAAALCASIAVGASDPELAGRVSIDVEIAPPPDSGAKGAPAQRASESVRLIAAWGATGEGATMTVLRWSGTGWQKSAVTSEIDWLRTGPRAAKFRVPWQAMGVAPGSSVRGVVRWQAPPGTDEPPPLNVTAHHGALSSRFSATNCRAW